MSAPNMSAPFGSAELIPRSQRGPSPRRVVVGYGFWLFLLSDIILFAVLFAAYAVLKDRTAGGPAAGQLFDRGTTLIETACLLTSTFSCGLLSLAIDRSHRHATYLLAGVTFLLGFAFLALELSEFGRLLVLGAGPARSAFLSAYFTLVGAHGLHVSAGLVWLLLMLAQIASLGYRAEVTGRLRCFCLYWHALGIVWIGVFTIVYLGMRP